MRDLRHADVEIGRDRLERTERRRERVRVVIEGLAQVLRERTGVVISKVEGHAGSGGDGRPTHLGRLHRRA